MTIKEINKQIHELELQRRELEKKEVEEFKLEAVNNVGRCFIINGKYAKVINIPQEEWDMSGNCHYNKYQYPALYLSDELVPFYEDTLFSGAWGVGHDILNKYVEITPEEFEIEFEKKLNKFRNKILNEV